MPKQHAFEYVAGTTPTTAGDALAVIFGNDATLRRWAIETLVGDGDWTQFDGDTTRWSDLRDDLATASLFDFDAGDKRTIVVRSADKFVSAHRTELEKYVAAPGDSTRFVLELDSLASNTRLYKAADKNHLLVACGNATDTKQGVTAATRRKFLTGHIAARHQVKLAVGAADALVEMLGDETGMLDTEIAKLALYVDVGGKIDEPLVRDIVAGWQGKTVWQITDAIASGDAAEALRQLDNLFTGGQKAIALLPQISWSLRRLGMATTLIEQRERSGRPWQFEDILASAGIRRPSEIQSAKNSSKQWAGRVLSNSWAGCSMPTCGSRAPTAPTAVTVSCSNNSSSAWPGRPDAVAPVAWDHCPERLSSTAPKSNNSAAEIRIPAHKHANSARCHCLYANRNMSPATILKVGRTGPVVQHLTDLGRQGGATH